MSIFLGRAGWPKLAREPGLALALAGPSSKLTAPKPRNLVLDRSGPAWWGAPRRRGGSGQDTDQEELGHADTQWDLGECSQHLHNLGARQKEVKNSHVRRFINHSQFKSQGFTQLLSVPQTRALGRNQFNCGGQISRPTIKQLIVCHCTPLKYYTWLEIKSQDGTPRTAFQILRNFFMGRRDTFSRDSHFHHTLLSRILGFLHEMTHLALLYSWLGKSSWACDISLHCINIK